MIERTTLLKFALKGLDAQRAEIEKELEGAKPVEAPPSNGGGKRVLSEAARKRMAAAQRKRWRKIKKGKKA